MAAELTARQREVFDLFVQRELRRQNPPSLRELAAAMGIKSVNGTNSHLRLIEKKGYLERMGDAQARSYRITAAHSPVAKLVREAARLAEACCEANLSVLAARFTP